MMEVKLSQRNRADRFSLLPKLLPSLTDRNWANTKTSFNNQFRAIALKWRFQLQDMCKDQFSTKHHFVLIVEGSESSTSISIQNGVPSHSIVMANRKIMDTDLEQKEQDIKIQNPRAIRDIHQLQEKLQSSLNRLQNYKKLFVLASPPLPPARTTSFIVLVPLIVFCARCIIGASHARVFGTPSRLETVNKPEGERHKLRSGHWRSALRDIRELDGLDSELSIDSTGPSEEQISIEDLSHVYKKLDQDYQKFLSECGLSKWGYWRGDPEQG